MMEARKGLSDATSPPPRGEGMGEGGASADRTCHALRGSPHPIPPHEGEGRAFPGPRGKVARWLLAGLLSLAVAAPATAAPPLDGAEAPDLQSALALWLDGDEATALPAMAGLAAEGNAAAQLLLGVINVTPSLQGPWLDAQGRAARIALLRRPGEGQGLSGKSWFTAPADPRAAAWAEALRAEAPMTVILDFARLGEPRAAAEAAFRMISRQRRGFAALAADPDFPARLAAYAALERGSPDGLAPADPHRALFAPQAAEPEALSDWIGAEADAVAALCDSICPQEAEAVCRPAALAGLGGALGLLHTGSPVEALVPSADFNRSAKAVEMMLALMSPAAHAAAPSPSPCLGDALK